MAERTSLFNPLTSMTDYTDEEREFFLAVERYKRENGRKFLTLRETLHIARALGYRKVEKESPLPRFMKKSGGRPKKYEE